MDTARVVLVTCPDLDVARTLARALVDRRLVACANLVPGLTSIYRYEGKIHEDAEVLLVLKTTESRLAELEAAVVELHPYDVPEFVALSARRVEARYAAWLEQETARD